MTEPADQVALELRDGEVVLPVKAQPGAKKNAIVGVHAGALKVAVTAAPEQGKANQAIVELLAEALDLRRSDVELLSGAASRAKKFVVRGIAADELRERLRRRLG